MVPNAPDTGWGESTGSESPPELKLIPSHTLFVHVDTPTEDWGDWNDPRVHIAYAANLLEAATNSGEIDLGSVTSAARAVRQTSVLATLSYSR